MPSIPKQLLDTFSDADRSAIVAWWESLSEQGRTEVATACDERLDSCFFGVVNDDRDHVIPKVRGGKFVPSDDCWGFDEWGPSYFEHLIQHPELVLVWDPPQQTFHVGCTRHADARRCWQECSVAANFQCPFKSSDCLMHSLLGRRINWLKKAVV